LLYELIGPIVRSAGDVKARHDVADDANNESDGPESANPERCSGSCQANTQANQQPLSNSELHVGLNEAKRDPID
jgi:hypothetical protein